MRQGHLWPECWCDECDQEFSRACGMEPTRRGTGIRQPRPNEGWLKNKYANLRYRDRARAACEIGRRIQRHRGTAGQGAVLSRRVSRPDPLIPSIWIWEEDRMMEVYRDRRQFRLDGLINNG